MAGAAAPAAAALAAVAVLAAASAAPAATTHGTTDTGRARLAWDWLQASPRMRRDALGDMMLAHVIEHPWIVMPLAAVGSAPVGAAPPPASRRQSMPTFTPRLGRDSAGDDLAEEEAEGDGDADGGHGQGQLQLAPPFWPRPGRHAPPLPLTPRLGRAAHQATPAASGEPTSA
nr:PK-like protein [Schistocerca gregaria]